MSDLVAAVFLSRTALVRLLNGPITSGTLVLWVLTGAAGSAIYLAGSGGTPLSALLLGIGLLLLQAGLLEPLLYRFYALSISDEQEFHWRRNHRDNLRRLVLFATGGFLLVLAVTIPLLNLLAPGYAWPIATASLWWVGCAARYHRQATNHSYIYGIAVATVTLFAGSIAAALIIIDTLLAVLTLATLLITAWRATADLRDRRLIHQSLQVLEHEEVARELEEQLIELVYISGYPAGARQLLKQAIADFSTPARIRLTSLSGEYFLALELGLAEAKQWQAEPRFHLAMAEASFGARDPENGAAHAEESIDRAGGLASLTAREAYLYRALSSFNQLEQITGRLSCEAILNGPEDGSARSRRIRRDAHLLMATFADQAAAE